MSDKRREIARELITNGKQVYASIKVRYAAAIANRMGAHTWRVVFQKLRCLLTKASNSIVVFKMPLG